MHKQESMIFKNIPALLSEALVTRGYAAPTPVQAAVLETEAEGRDLIVSAQTGSGKTVAFGLAIAAQLLDEKSMALPAEARRTVSRSIPSKRRPRNPPTSKVDVTMTRSTRMPVLPT